MRSGIIVPLTFGLVFGCVQCQSASSLSGLKQTRSNETTTSAYIDGSVGSNDTNVTTRDPAIPSPPWPLPPLLPTTLRGAPRRPCPPKHRRIFGRCELDVRPCPDGHKVVEGKCQMIDGTKNKSDSSSGPLTFGPVTLVDEDTKGSIGMVSESVLGAPIRLCPEQGKCQDDSFSVTGPPDLANEGTTKSVDLSARDPDHEIPLLGLPDIIVPGPSVPPLWPCPPKDWRILGKCRLEFTPCPAGQRAVDGDCRNVQRDLRSASDDDSDTKDASEVVSEPEISPASATQFPPGAPGIAGAPLRPCPSGQKRIDGKCKLEISPCPAGQGVIDGECQNVQRDERSAVDDVDEAKNTNGTVSELEISPTNQTQILHGAAIAGAPPDLCASGLTSIDGMCKLVISPTSTSQRVVDGEHQYLPSSSDVVGDANDSNGTVSKPENSFTNGTKIPAVLFSISGAPLRPCPAGQKRIGGKCKLAIAPCPDGQKIVEGTCRTIN